MQQQPPAPTPPPAQPPATDSGAPVPLDFKFEDLKIPDGMEAMPEHGTKFLDIIGDQKMAPRDRAQALIDLQGAVMQSAAEKIGQAFQQVRDGWVSEAKANKDWGGDKLPKTLEGIGKLLEVHGSPEVRKLMDETGAGDNPHMIAFLNKMAGLLNEPSPINGGSPTAQQKSLAESLYPSMRT